MIQVIVVIILLAFTTMGVMMAAGPLMEGIVPVIANDDAVQEMGHASIISDIQTAVLVYVPLTIILGMIGWGFIWVIRREQVLSRR